MGMSLTDIFPESYRVYFRTAQGGRSRSVRFGCASADRPF